MIALARLAAEVALLAPCVLLLTLGVAGLRKRLLSERQAGATTKLLLGIAFLAALVAAGAALRSGEARLWLDYGDWLDVPGHRFELLFVLDRLSCVLLVLALGMCNVVASFAHRYLHREIGYNRFFATFALFALGIELVALGGTLQIAVVGWEFLGVSSALLVAFFHDRSEPVRNGLRIYGVYRVSDLGLICAAVLVHLQLGTTSYRALLETADGTPLHDGTFATTVSLLLVVAATVKCAQLPYSDWLPRAMEGPTPSSAIFYGAISVHAGVFVLLRAAPLLDASPAARIVLAVVGATSVLHAAVVGRAQTDVKAILAYATVAQVGIILVEIALGLHTWALVHACGHACLRALQFLRAPSVLHDLHAIESAVGVRSAATTPHGRRPSAALYRYALERGYFENRIETFVLSPFRRFFRAVDRFDRACCGIFGPSTAPRDGEAAAEERRRA